MKRIDEATLASLRETVMESMSPKRFRHTVAVEAMIERLCALFCPEYTMQMRAAALLHDLTKELDTAAQLALCERYGLEVTVCDRLSPKTFHARTAAAKIQAEMPAFDDEMIVNAVRWHTTGHAGMTLTEKLLYLADYIDDSRTFESCVALRNFFFDADPSSMSKEEREAHLRRTLIRSYDYTIRDLIEEGRVVSDDTFCARNELLVDESMR